MKLYYDIEGGDKVDIDLQKVVDFINTRSKVDVTAGGESIEYPAKHRITFKLKRKLKLYSKEIFNSEKQRLREVSKNTDKPVHLKQTLDQLDRMNEVLKRDKEAADILHSTMKWTTSTRKSRFG